MKVDFKQLRDLMAVLREFDLGELEIKHGDERIRLRRAVAPVVPARPAEATRTSSGSVAAQDDPSVAFVTSPFVGTFYRATSPDAEPFVNIGDAIGVGTPLCIVEAMKLMNEIESDVTGTVTDVLVDNGKPVEFGDRLFKIKLG